MMHDLEARHQHEMMHLAMQKQQHLHADVVRMFRNVTQVYGGV